MDTYQWRTIILKLQDRLSDDDRKRLHFFLGNDVPRYIQDDLSTSGTLRLMESLIHQDKINERDMTLVINALEKIQCTDAAELLKQHMKQIPSDAISMIPSISAEVNDNSVSKYGLVDEKHCHNSNNFPIIHNNTNVHPVTVILGDQTKFPLQSKQKQRFNLSYKGNRCLIVVIMISLILTGIVIGGCIGFNYGYIKYDRILHKQAKTDEKLQHINMMLSRCNETIQQLTKKQKHDENEQNDDTLVTNSDFQSFETFFIDSNVLAIKIKNIEGTTCGCQKWCNEHVSPYGVCGDGPTCICSKNPITKEYASSGCTCDQWCRENGHKDGGICGDGYTCICSK